MTSFLNKKTNIILIILATLIIATTISSVAADDTGTISFGNDDPTLIKNATPNQIITINGSFAGDVDIGFVGMPTANSRIIILAHNGTSYTELKRLTLTPGTWTNISSWSATFNTAELKGLGTHSIVAFYIHDITQYVDITNGYNGLAGLTTSTKLGITATGGTTGWDATTDPASLILYLKGKVAITSMSTLPGLKVGQISNFTGYVKGTDASNLAGPMIGLHNVLLEVGYYDASNTWINVTPPLYSGDDGNFSFSYKVLDLKFELIVRTVMSASDVNWYTVKSSLINWAPAPPLTYSTYFENNIGTDAFTANPGTINITALWFNSTTGYIVGDSATVFWNLDDYGNLPNQNIWAYLVLYNTNNNKQLRQRIVVNLTEDQSGLNISTGSFILTPWLKTHQNITVKLVIEGLLVPDADRYYTVSSNSNSTFVDKDANSRRTTVRFANPTQLKNLRVGETCLITFDVLDYTGAHNTAFNGQIKVTWDTTFSALVDVVNGTAQYYHTYLKAGTNRTITAQFLGDVANNASASVILREITDVLKGNATIGFNHDPYAHTGFVGVQSLFDIFVAKIVVDSKYAPKEINVRFVNSANNKTVLSRNLALTADLLNSTMAFAEYAHVYLKLYNPSPLVVYLSIKGNDNYVDSTTLAYNILVANP